MDGVRNMGLNPMSSQFMARTARVAQTQMATVKDKKELEKKDEPKDTGDDMVTLSNAGEKSIKDKADSAAGAGVMSELMKREKKESADELTMFGGEGKVYERESQPEAGKDAGAKGKAEEMDLDTKIEVMSIMNRSPEEIRGEVPQAFFDAGKKIVEGQIKKGEPTGELKQLKAVETAPIELAPIKNVEIMPIHDSHNKPMQMSMGAGV